MVLLLHRSWRTFILHALWCFSSQQPFLFICYGWEPAKDNPYLPVRAEDAEGGEYGLDDGDQGVERSMSGTDGSIGVDGKALRTTPSGEATMGVQMLPLR